MSIRFKILIPMVVISVLAASTILFFNIVQFSSFVENYIEEELERAILEAQDEIKRMKTESSIAILYYANDNKLIAAMERGEREAVLNRTQEMFAQTDIESLTIVDANAIVVARAHNPDLYGDDTSAMPVVRSALSGHSGAGAERGISTNISVRASSPVYGSQGQVIGAMFAGDRMDTEKFADRLKNFTGCEITVLVGDVRVATTLVDENGMRATGTSEPEYIDVAMLPGNAETIRTSFKDRTIMTKNMPVFNNSGDIIGIVSVGKYLTEKQSMEMSFIMTGFLISLIFIATSILAILFVSRQIADPINRKIDLADYDKLTGIFNRRFLEERLSRVLKTLSRSNGIISLMMIDIDFFKGYNDTYGHVKGDDCLREIAAVLTHSVLRTDDFVARYGGEEFVVVLPNTDEAGVRIMSERMLEHVRERRIPHEKNGTLGYVTISIGATTGSVSRTLNSTDIIERADLGLYESKRNGRNQYTFMAMD